MVHHHRKQDSADLTNLLPLAANADYCKCARKPATTTLLRRLLLLLAVLSFSFFISFLSYSLLAADEHVPPLQAPSDQQLILPCSSVPNNNSLCCDRSDRRTDVCFMRGLVRTHSPSKSLFLVDSASNTTSSSSSSEEEEQRIRPYTRKWEPSTMATIDELRLLRTANQTDGCDVRHDVPAVFFSTGGYTGNVYHEFNDGIVPLYVTSSRFGGKVVFVILEYHDWWVSKYGDILSRLSDFPPLDFAADTRSHCFPEAVVGLAIHDELAIDAARKANNKTIRDFRDMLDEAYRPRILDIVEEEKKKNMTTTITTTTKSQKPKLVIVSRNGSRGIENEGELVKLAQDIGFRVQVLAPKRTTELAKIYRALNSSDVMVGVHGAAMTHLLFMRPGAVFVQVVPLGTDWAAEAYYGEPAAKLGLKYVRYAISARESSLYREYPRDDPVLRDPESVNAKGWEVTKKVYLDGQNVNLDLQRFRKRLVRAHGYLLARRTRNALSTSEERSSV